MYNYSAISGISLLSQKTNKHKRFLNEEEQNKIIENLKLVENWLSESRFEFLDSDKEEYTVKYQIDTSFLNEKNVYTFYYNETLKEEDEYFIEGIVEFNNEIYSMYGKKEIEDTLKLVNLANDNKSFKNLSDSLEAVPLPRAIKST